MPDKFKLLYVKVFPICSKSKKIGHASLKFLSTMVTLFHV